MLEVIYTNSMIQNQTIRLACLYMVEYIKRKVKVRFKYKEKL